MKTQNFRITILCFMLTLMISSVLNAQIIYTDIPDTTIAAGQPVFNIDLNNDGISDYYFYRTESTVLGGIHCSGTKTNFVSGINELNGNFVIVNGNYGPTPLAYETFIDSNSVSWTDTTQKILGRSYGCSLNPFTLLWGWHYSDLTWSTLNGYPVVPDSSSYIGLKFQIGAQIHYGWVRLSTNTNANPPSFTIQDYAYNSIPDETIIAGAGSNYCYDIEWSKSYGGLHGDYSNFSDKTSDGGFIICGRILGDSGNVSGYHAGQDNWVIKLDSSGNLQWQNSLGGSNDDQGLCIHQTADLGYIISGSSTSNDFDVSGHHGLNTTTDGWIVKLDSGGNLIWQKSIGGSSNDVLNYIEETPDGGFITAGYTYSNDGDVTGLHDTVNFCDAWVVKLDSSRNIVWEKCIGGTNSDFINTIKINPAGGFIGAGYTKSNDFDVSGNNGLNDCWVIKLDTAGTLFWQKCYGGSKTDVFWSMTLSSNGGFAFAGNTNSTDSDVTGFHGGYSDYWVVQTDSSGVIQFQKCLGGTDNDAANNIIQTMDGGYAVSGYANSRDGDVKYNHSQSNYNLSDNWFVKLDSTGNIDWQRVLGGTNEEYTSRLEQTNDGSYVITGTSESTDGNVYPGCQNSLPSDYWIVKFHSQYSTFFQSPVICQGTNFVVGNNSYDSAGTYTDTLSAITVCDSIIITNLSVIICTDVLDLESDIQDLQITPNPFSNSTTISFMIPQSENISIKIFDLTGRLIKSNADREFKAGENQFMWNGDDEDGSLVNSGIYVVRLDDEKFIRMKRVVLIH